MDGTLQSLRNQGVGGAYSSAVTEHEAEGQHQWLKAASTIASDMTNSDSQMAI